MTKVFVLIGVSDMTNGHLASLAVHNKIIKKNGKHTILHFSFVYNNDTDIYGNIEEQCEQISCNFNHNNTYIIGITCNTMHLYFDYYLQCTNSSNVKLLNVIDITIKYLCKKKYNIIGLLSTQLTRDTHLYSNELERCNIKLLEVNDIEQKHLMNIISDIKSDINDNIKGKKILLKMMNDFKKKGASAIILGCSELPLLITEKKINDMVIINPMSILAKQMIKS